MKSLDLRLLPSQLSTENLASYLPAKLERLSFLTESETQLVLVEKLVNPLFLPKLQSLPHLPGLSAAPREVVKRLLECWEGREAARVTV